MAEQNIDKGHDYGLLVAELGRLIESSRSQIEEAIRVSMLRLYWDLGRQIVEFEQKGKSRAAYSTQLVVELSRDLVLQYGKGFSASNLYNMRLFYQRYPIFQTSGKLSWGHYCELAPIDDDLERSFYEKQCALEENGESGPLEYRSNEYVYGLFCSGGKYGWRQSSNWNRISPRQK